MRIIYSLLFLICFTFGFSQKNLGNALKNKMYENLLGNLYFDVLIEGDIDKIISQQTALGIKVKYHANNVACVSLNLSAVTPLLELKLVKYIEYIEPRKKPMNDTMVVRNRIKPVKQGLSPLPQAYDGTGVIVGIIDTGCDFNHPDFKDAAGNTRIMFIWDQAILTPTNVPAPFGYGQEWTSTQINSGLCTHNDLPYYGHGTGVTGIAAGNGKANGTHEGCAAKANIIVVALAFNKPGPIIADAVQYIVNKATAAGKPFVINASVGDYYGSHDGTDPEAKLIDGLIAGIPGRAMVAAAGNAGNYKFHTKNIVVPTDTNFTWFNSGVSTNEYWLYADTANIKNVKYSIGCNRPSFTDLGNIGFKNYNYCFSLKIDTLKFNSKRIGIVRSSASINPYGVYELYVKVLADSLNYNWRIESTGTGIFDAWNFDFVVGPLPTVAQYPKIVKLTAPDSISSIVSSFQCSKEIITVANYVNLRRYYDVNNNLDSTTEVAGNIAGTSSCGPSRTNVVVKPEVTASGASIFTSGVITLLPVYITNFPWVVANGGFHILEGGTSASSPVVAGLAALYMQAHPFSTNTQVRQAIINCCYSDGFTGALPNFKWGYGKLDGFATFTCALVTGIDNFYQENNSTVFPNPFQNITQLKFKEVVSGDLKIYNALGELVYSDKINSNEYIISKSQLPAAGVYFVNIKTPGPIYNYKIVATE